MKALADLKITDDQNSQSNPNVVVGKHGHLTLNIHPAKKGSNKRQEAPPSSSHHRPAACSPAFHCVVVVVLVFGAIFPNGAV